MPGWAGIETKMVTKSISLDDDLYFELREQSINENTSFSQLVELLIKRGKAYSTILEENERTKLINKLKTERAIK